MKQCSFLLESKEPELIFGKFPITTDIVEKALGNIKGWKCSSGGDGGENYCSYTKTKGHNRAEISIRIDGDNLDVKFYLYRTPDDNKYLHGYEKEVRHYTVPISKTLSIPDGKTWKDIDFKWLHEMISKFSKQLDNVKEEDLKNKPQFKFAIGDRVKICNYIKCRQKGHEAIVTKRGIHTDYGYNMYCCKIDDPVDKSMNGEGWCFPEGALNGV